MAVFERRIIRSVTYNFVFYISDVITLSSDSDDSDDLDDDDSDEVVMVPSDEGDDEEEEEGPEDVNNGGAHIDDSLNLPDPDGRVKVNIGHPPNEPDIYLAPQIAQAIRPHQVCNETLFLYKMFIKGYSSIPSALSLLYYGKSVLSS